MRASSIIVGQSFLNSIIYGRVADFETLVCEESHVFDSLALVSSLAEVYQLGQAFKHFPNSKIQYRVLDFREYKVLYAVKLTASAQPLSNAESYEFRLQLSLNSEGKIIRIESYMNAKKIYRWLRSIEVIKSSKLFSFRFRKGLSRYYTAWKNQEIEQGSIIASFAV